MISAAQCRAARGLLDWSQEKLAEQAQAGVDVIQNFEGGHVEARDEASLRAAFEAAGVAFADDERGVSLAAPPPKAIPLERLNSSNDE